jgi:hypothetical protein
MNTNYLIFGGILIVLILLTMTTSCVTPYHANSVYLKEYTYEGMEGEEQEGMDDEEEQEGMEEEEEQEGMEDEEEQEGMENEEEQEGMGGRKLSPRYLIQQALGKKLRQGFSNIEGMENEDEEEQEGMENEDEEEQEGFRGLGTSDYNNNAFILDQFSSAIGSAECAGKSSGLSNSKGPLCLSDDQKRLLQTRGGNATGMDSQIGGR